MPCDSSYMAANRLEIEVSRMRMLLEELKTGEPVDPGSSGWQGYLTGTYSCGPSRKEADALAEELCTALKQKEQLGTVSGYSLEMQMWWRDHQEADRKRGGD
jgi:hypothetical protein